LSLSHQVDARETVAVVVENVDAVALVIASVQGVVVPVSASRHVIIVWKRMLLNPTLMLNHLLSPRQRRKAATVETATVETATVKTGI
jgi:hypothetical protein